MGTSKVVHPPNATLICFVCVPYALKESLDFKLKSSDDIGAFDTNRNTSGGHGSGYTTRYKLKGI